MVAYYRCPECGLVFMIPRTQEQHISHPQVCPNYIAYIYNKTGKEITHKTIDRKRGFATVEYIGDW